LGIFSQLLSVVFAPILAFYILKDAGLFRAKFLGIFPNSWRGEINSLLRELGDVLERFVLGELLVSAIIGVLTALGMLILGVKFAFIIGLIAGLAELVPYFGPFIGAIPAIGFALLKSQTTAIYAALVILVIQQLEGNVISPAILGGSVGLHPFLVVFALLAGGELLGIWGLILAVPVAAMLRVLCSFLLEKLVAWDSQKR
jgi:predicted PurR-regulated permease PerM